MTRPTRFLFSSLAALGLIRTFAAGPDAHPGFDGIWNSATVTPLERPPQAARTNTGAGTYNTFFREFGSRTVKTLRTSIVTDPPDGRIPALTPAAAEVKRRRLDGQRNLASAQDAGLQDQCLAFLTAGPPMLPYSYNSNYQITQTETAFVVHAEMIHDSRIIHLDGRRHAALPVRDRRPHGLHATLEGRTDHGAVVRTYLRIRLPRRQLLVAEHAQRIPRQRTRSSQPRRGPEL